MSSSCPSLQPLRHSLLFYCHLQPGDEEEEYPEEEDREEGEGGVERVRRTKPKEKKATLLDTIEPAELEEKLLAPRDKRIQLEDKPERFQVPAFPSIYLFHLFITSGWRGAGEGDGFKRRTAGMDVNSAFRYLMH